MWLSVFSENTANNKKNRKENLVKAEQSSLYRHLEVLHLWCLEVFENAPKQPMVQADVKLLAENIVQAQSAVAMALNCDDLKQKFDILDVVVMSMTNVKSITKVFTEYSSSSERGNRIISKPQRLRQEDGDTFEIPQDVPLCLPQDEQTHYKNQEQI